MLSVPPRVVQNRLKTFRESGLLPLRLRTSCASKPDEN
jgi:hypothetical protein